ncbi:MAG: hypothetical protein PUB87_08325 [Eubacteriaceae bacterium]|nr:hypothetical protein [Eubacteriaceae bacterium]
MKKRLSLITLILLLAISSVNFSFASTQDQSFQQPEKQVEKLENLIDAKDVVSEISDTPKGYVANLDDTDIIIPREGKDNIETMLPTGDSVSLELPKEVNGVDGILTKDGTIVYNSSDEEMSLFVHATESNNDNGEKEIGVRATIIIEAATAPSVYEFKYDLPEGAYLISGSEVISDEISKNEVAAVGADGFILFTVKEPWAKDANGNSIPTYFTISGNKLMQHIEFNNDTSFPVVADPWYGTSSKTENIGGTIEKGFTAYAAGQGTKGFRFRNGGYISYSRGSGTTANVSLSLGVGYNAVTLSTSIGYAYEGDSIGTSYPVPKKDAWYKLKVTEIHNVQKYKIMRRWKDPETGRVTWKEYSRNAKIVSFAGLDAVVVKVADV